MLKSIRAQYKIVRTITGIYGRKSIPLVRTVRINFHPLVMSTRLSVSTGSGPGAITPASLPSGQKMLQKRCSDIALQRCKDVAHLSRMKSFAT